ncbi:MAG TPA: hypothetical protein VNT03_19205, partial [Baekduia sp.]|nr:hypothetical protein [Baekduia sp.]
MPALRRRSRARDGGDAGDEPVAGVDPAVPWALGDVLRDGPAPLADRPPRAAEDLDVALVLGPGQSAPRDAGLPAELLTALADERVAVRVLTADDLDAEVDGDPSDPPAAADPLATADVVLAAGWPAAPAVLAAPGVRARAVLATPEAPPLAD